LACKQKVARQESVKRKTAKLVVEMESQLSTVTEKWRQKSNDNIKVMTTYTA